MRLFGETRRPFSFLCFLMLFLAAGSAVHGQSNELVVVSPYGTPSPAGTNYYDGPTSIVNIAIVDHPVISTNPNVRYFCTGWTGVGTTPGSGSDTNELIAFDIDATVTWQWKTQYLFSATAANSNGSVSAANGWYDIGSVVSATATPSNNYLFSGWYGDVPVGRTLDNPLNNLTMDQPRVITGLFANVMYVSKTGGAVPPYATWATAANAIEDALSTAPAGMTIMVSNGTYNIPFELMLTNSIRLKGFNGPNVTTIDGGGVRRCATLSAGSSVEGFTVTGGYVVNGSGTNTYEFAGKWGGGLLLDKGGTVSNCVVTGNEAEKGGGIFCYDGGLIDACVISSNVALSAGGGHGGGVFVNSNGMIRSCLVIENDADYGGGLRCEYGGSILNSTICSNEAVVKGGGLYMADGGEVRDTIIYYNTDSPSFPDGYNYQNVGNISSGPKYYYCCTFPSVASVFNGGNNITAVPQFADRFAGDYSLRNTSPCVDTGENAVWMQSALDIAGTNRILNGTVDRGAYEFAPPMITSWSGPNGTVDPSGTYTVVSDTNGIMVVSVTYSNNITYNMNPATYYKVDDVVVDGLSIGPTNSYTFTGVTSNHTIYATFSLNRPTLVVNSLYGTTFPPIGTNDYEAGSLLDCFILDTDGVTNGTTRYMFTGWTGTGSVPSSGSGSAFGFTIMTDSTLTWGWKTQYLFTAVSASPSGQVSPSNAWYDAGQSNVMVTATPDNGWLFTGWTGDVPATNANDNPLYLTMDQARSITGNFEIIRVTLTVNSLIDGGPTPAVGVYTNDWGTSVTCSMANATVWDGPSTQFVLLGWTGSGDIPLSGGGSSVSATLTTNSTITWNWKTRYALYTDSDPEGIVSPFPTGPYWYDAGTVVECYLWARSADYRFSYWSGDVPVDQIYDEPLFLTMDMSRSIYMHMDYVPPVMYVSPGGSHSFPYDTWPTAATNISTAVDAGGFGSVVHVANGTYTLTSTVNLDDEVILRSVNGPSTAIIDGGDALRCIDMSHSNAAVYGFTIRNGAATDGAGIFMTDGGTVSNCVIESNAAGNRGGGAYIRFGGMLQHSIIRNNSAGSFGAGVVLRQGGTLRNCLVIRNGSLSAPIRGGGVYCDRGGVVESCTIATNLASQSGGGVDLDEGGSVSNSIVYYNLVDGIADYNNWRNNAGTPIAYSCTYPLASGDGCEQFPPMFSDIDSDNYIVMEGSVCVDGGLEQGWMAGAPDLAGSARVQGSSVDMGVYEDYVPVHTITASAGTGGTIAPSGPILVADGGSETFTITATGAYEIAQVLIDSSPIGPTNSYTFTGVIEDHTIEAFFSATGFAPLGTPVWWLEKYGLTAGDEQTDPDHDGHDVWEEYIANTDPTNGASYLRITDVSVLGSGDHVVTWASTTGRFYSIMTLGDIATGSWSFLVGHTNLPGVEPSMTRTNTTPDDVRYYRIRVSL